MSVNERGHGSNPHLGTKRKHQYTLGCRDPSRGNPKLHHSRNAVLCHYPCRHPRRPTPLFCAPTQSKDLASVSLFTARLGAESNQMSVSILCVRTLQKSLRTCHSRHRRSSVPKVAFAGMDISSVPCREPSASTLTNSLHGPGVGQNPPAPVGMTDRNEGDFAVAGLAQMR